MTTPTLVLNETITDKYAIYHGDCIETIRGMPDNSLDCALYSPPFESLFTYSDSERDMGNSADTAEFGEHYRFLVKELYRVLKPGRLCIVHCMDLTITKWNSGYIGLRDFPGDIIRFHQQEQFIYHSRVTIWKDPVTAMQRTKALGLLYKQLRKDSCMSRQGIPDTLIVLRKPGDNPDPVTKTHDGFPVARWQRYASPVWFDINQSNTLQKESAREEKDEKHICPLQLDVIDRCIELWTNPGDLILDPFTGIGSTGHVAIQRGRRFVGTELKESYYKQAVANCRAAVEKAHEPTLFDMTYEKPEEEEAAV
jgi:DNA modification methylase